MNKIQIMGILNMTPDSFYDGRKQFKGQSSIETSFKKNINADIIDIGGESSRPGSKPVDFKTEIDRISPLSKYIKKYNKIFSIDTYKYEVAKYALDNGYGMINDIYAGRYDKRIFKLAFEYNVPIVLMHMQGTPVNMQDNIKYNSIIEDIIFFFKDRIEEALSYGISKNNIILDPGIGFGKSKQDNFLIIKNIYRIKKLGYKILLGISRKSFLSFNNDMPNERLASSISMNTVAAINGVDILRVHDVDESISIVNTISNYLKV